LINDLAVLIGNGVTVDTIKEIVALEKGKWNFSIISFDPIGWAFLINSSTMIFKISHLRSVIFMLTPPF
jgi:hypothetical protein